MSDEERPPEASPGAGERGEEAAAGDSGAAAGRPDLRADVGGQVRDDARDDARDDVRGHVQADVVGDVGGDGAAAVPSGAAAAVPSGAASARPHARGGRRRDEAESLSPFSVVVGQVYDGPLDLLLDLIRRQDIDIYDIPIARITAQFLGYVESLRQSDVDAAGEFIYTAALLIHIKSRMLLPRAPAEAGEAESEDPRRELVERLLEHERFKNAAQMLRQKQQIEEATWTRPGLREFQPEDDERAIAADSVDLVRVFREVLERVKQRPVLNVDEESVTVGQMIDYMRRRLSMEERPVRLSQMLRNARSERAVICMFLALLELVRLQAILLRQERTFGDILVKKNEAFEQVMNDTLAARDDWR